MANKKARMTDRQRVEALCRREKPDRVPIWPFAAMGFSAVYSRASIVDAYNNPEVAMAGQRKTAQDFGWVYMPMMGYAAFGGWEFGGEIKWPGGEFSQAPSVLRHPVETPDDVMKLRLPDVKTAGIIPLQVKFNKLTTQERLDNEPWNVSCKGGGVFTLAGNIPGPDKLAKWVLKKPEAVHRLMRLATDFTIDLVKYWVELFGKDAMLPLSGEPTSANQLISAKQFEEFAMPYIKEAHEKLLKMGFKHLYMHICGEHNANLPHWQKIPFGDPGIVSIGHEITLETAGKAFPRDIILGNLEPAIIQVRTAQETYEATKKNIQDGMAKCPGGYIFSPGCEMPPRANIDNVKAVTRAVEDHGWFD